MKMKKEALFVAIILFLGLVLCCLLGGKGYRLEGFQAAADKDHTSSKADSGLNANMNMPQSFDHYNHFNGSSTPLANGNTYTSTNGGTVTVGINTDGTQSLKLVLDPNDPPITLASGASSGGQVNMFHGPKGESAIIIQGNDGQEAIRVQTSKGTMTFVKDSSVTKDTPYQPASNNYNNTSSTYFGSTGSTFPTGKAALAFGGNVTYYGPNGGKATLNANGENTLTVTSADGITTVYKGLPSSNGYITTYNGPNGGKAVIVTQPNGNKAVQVTDAHGSTMTYISKSDNGNDMNMNSFYNMFSSGSSSASSISNNGMNSNSNKNSYNHVYSTEIPRSQIPAGQEDLYILKSEVVPPVCPACPASNIISRQEKCPPCPACARCPEPAFECKKVPNYSAVNSSYMPIPVLNDFSTFGM